MRAMRELLRKLRFAPRKIGYFWGPKLMSWLRKRWLLFRHPHAEIVFQGPVYLGPGFSLHVPGKGRFIVGPESNSAATSGPRSARGPRSSSAARRSSPTAC